VYLVAMGRRWEREDEREREKEGKPWRAGDLMT
jgi:hypothetical protein